MPYPHRAQESSDARAALMANLSSQSPLHVDRIARSPTRSAQAHRPAPYSVPKRKLTEECRKTRLLGRGAFLKDENLRTPQGKLLRAAQGACPTQAPALSFHCPEKRPSPLWEESSIEVRKSLRRGCCTANDDSARDCITFSPTHSLETGTDRVQRTEPSQVHGDDCEMPHWGTSHCSPFDLELESAALQWGHDASGSSRMGEQLCNKTADELFLMFIDETCMEAIEEN
ncbi:hypothetical protein B0H19DRAFT_1101802 [Mycena capillaripes]|nr:hypothetical protein B0H19DRAFT_1101802 [Mycena capillaripes]